jgi:spore maturation protein CgeB
MLKERTLDVVVLGLSITSSWGNGHATTYRSLLGGLCELGHRVLFLERDVPWYANNRDAPSGLPPTELYRDVVDLKRRYGSVVRGADLVIVGSYVPDGVEIGDWVTRTALGLTAFYDIDTPITWRQLLAGQEEYISKALIPRYSMYLSFAGGPILNMIERKFGSPCARPLYCAVDPRVYYPEPRETRWDLAYMGTYSADRQPTLERLLLEPARQQCERRFAVYGPQYPEGLLWPENVERSMHLAPDQHRSFYNEQRFTLNVTREAMREVGYSPSVRLFEAAACGTPIISDVWPGLETLFEPGSEILIAENSKDVMSYLSFVSEPERKTIAERARQRVLAHHTGTRRAQELVAYMREATADTLSTTVGAP